MQISVKTSKGEVYAIDTDGKESTVQQLKEKIEEKVNVPISKIRLIHVGKLLKNEETLSSYNLEEGSTVHLVIPNTEKAPTEKTPQQEKDTNTHSSLASDRTSTGTSAYTPFPGAGVSGAAGHNPFGLDPAAMKGFSDMSNQDGMQAMMHSKMKELMKNPEQMKMIMEASLSMQNIPEQTKAMMRDNINKFSEMAKTNPEQFEVFINHILDNPNMSNLYMGQGMGGFGGQAPSFSAEAPNRGSSNLPPGVPSFNREEALRKYSSELQELQQIGYSDVEMNLVALVCTEGDLTKAVNLIMDWTSEDAH